MHIQMARRLRAAPEWAKEQSTNYKNQLVAAIRV